MKIIKIELTQEENALLTAFVMGIISGLGIALLINMIFF